MVKILFFAQLREQLKCNELNWPIDSSVSVEFLQDALAEQGENWQRNLTKGNILVAVNQSIAQLDTKVHPGDEVAFFPPVTGG